MANNQTPAEKRAAARRVDRDLRDAHRAEDRMRQEAKARRDREKARRGNGPGRGW